MIQKTYFNLSLFLWIKHPRSTKSLFGHLPHGIDKFAGKHFIPDEECIQINTILPKASLFILRSGKKGKSGGKKKTFLFHMSLRNKNKFFPKCNFLKCDFILFLIQEPLGKEFNSFSKPNAKDLNKFIRKSTLYRAIKFLANYYQF